MSHPPPPRESDDGLLPREFVVLQFIGPIVTAPLLLQDFFSQPVGTALRKALGLAVPFLSLGLTFVVLYRTAVPALLRHAHTAPARAVVHALVTVVVAATLGRLVLPVHNVFCEAPAQPLRFVVICVTISAIQVASGLALQGQRRRTRAVELAMLRERQAALEAHLRGLQARANPHFLFNSINTVASLIHEDPTLAERTLERLADVFRYSLEGSGARTVPLRDELAVVRDYLAIQSVRYGKRLRTELRFDDALGETPVPPLSLLPLVENALMHGVSRRKGGSVTVRSYRRGDAAVVDVIDDGPGPGLSLHRGSQTAVRELRERLALVYGGESGGSLTLEPALDGGCVARMVVPAAGPAAGAREERPG